VFNVLIASGKMKAPRPVAGAVASMVAHGAIVTLVLISSRPAIRAATEFEERIAEYFFPKDRAPKLGEESLAYLRVPAGVSASTAASGGSDQSTGRDVRTTAHDPLMLQTPKPAAGSAGAPDLIAEQQKMAEAVGAFALLDVDSAAVRDSRSAAPAYPADMEARGVEGLVKVRFVVDSTGLIDVGTIKVLETTNESFARAVRAAMPGMRFRPAMIGGKFVRQLSEQEFAFKVQPKAVAPTILPAVPVKKPNERR
jgi:TonB family protein